MTDRRTLRAVLSGAIAAMGGRPAAAQTVTEWGPTVMVTTAAPVAVLAGGSWGVRPGTRDRLVIGGGLGSADGALAGRGEVSWHFLLSPGKVHGPALYGGGGVAAARAREWRGYLLLTAGVDWNPGGPSGWMAEAGIGGGLRVVVGYRWRRGGRQGVRRRKRPPRCPRGGPGTACVRAGISLASPPSGDASPVWRTAPPAV